MFCDVLYNMPCYVNWMNWNISGWRDDVFENMSLFPNLENKRIFICSYTYISSWWGFLSIQLLEGFLLMLHRSILAMVFELVSGLAQLVGILLVLHAMGKLVFVCARCEFPSSIYSTSPWHRILALRPRTCEGAGLVLENPAPAQLLLWWCP